MKESIKIFKLLTILFFAAIFTGCGEEEDPTSAITLYDVVKYESLTSNGSVFTLQKPEAESGVVYTTSQVLPTRLFEVGDRLLIGYVPASGKAYESGEITLTGYRAITNAEMKEEEPEKIMGWDEDPVFLYSAWRSGDYLNIRADLPYYSKPRVLALVKDLQSPDPERPDLYLFHAIEPDLNTFDRTYYISFDISALTQDEAIKGFTLHLNNSNLKLDILEFDLQRPSAAEF